MQPVNATRPWHVTPAEDLKPDYPYLQAPPAAISPLALANHSTSRKRGERSPASPRGQRSKVKKCNAHKTSRTKSYSPTSGSPKISQASFLAAKTSDSVCELLQLKRKKQLPPAKRPEEMAPERPFRVSKPSGHKSITLPSPRGIYDGYSAHAPLTAGFVPLAPPVPFTVRPPFYQDSYPNPLFSSISPNSNSQAILPSPTVPPHLMPLPLPARSFPYPASMGEAQNFPQGQPCVACLLEGKTQPNRMPVSLMEASSPLDKRTIDGYKLHTLPRGPRQRSPVARHGRAFWDWKSQTLNGSSSTTPLTSESTGSSATDHSTEDRPPNILSRMAYFGLGIAAAALLLLLTFYVAAHTIVKGSVLPGFGHGEDLATVAPLEEGYLEWPPKSKLRHLGTWTENENKMFPRHSLGSHLIRRTQGSNSSAIDGTNEQ